MNLLHEDAVQGMLHEAAQVAGNSFWQCEMDM